MDTTKGFHLTKRHIFSRTQVPFPRERGLVQGCNSNPARMFCNCHSLEGLCFANPNDTAGQTGTGVSSGLAQFVSTQAQVVRIGVDNNGTSQDAQRSGQGNLTVGDVDLGHSAVIGHNVAQVSGVSFGGCGSSVFLAVRVEVRSGRGASVGVVTELVDVESVVARLESSHLTGHLDGVRISLKMMNKMCTKHK